MKLWDCRGCGGKQVDHKRGSRKCPADKDFGNVIEEPIKIKKNTRARKLARARVDEEEKSEIRNSDTSARKTARTHLDDEEKFVIS